MQRKSDIWHRRGSTDTKEWLVSSVYTDRIEERRVLNTSKGFLLLAKVTLTFYNLWKNNVFKTLFKINVHFPFYHFTSGQGCCWEPTGAVVRARCRLSFGERTRPLMHSIRCFLPPQQQRWQFFAEKREAHLGDRRQGKWYSQIFSINTWSCLGLLQK